MGYFIIIPDEVRKDNSLSTFARLLYGDILSKSTSSPCWASNQRFAEEYGKQKRTVQSALRCLEDRGYIRIEYSGEGNQQRLLIPLVQTRAEINTPHAEKDTDTNAEICTVPVQKNTSIKEEGIRRSFSSDSFAYQSAAYLSKQLDARKQSGKATTEAEKQCWASDFDKCQRLDGHPWEEIGAVLEWCQQDHFWQGNIRSGASFRKHYDRLADSATRTGGKNYANP